MRPDRGPARKTTDIIDFETPRERRKGEAGGAERSGSRRKEARKGENTLRHLTTPD